MLLFHFLIVFHGQQSFDCRFQDMSTQVCLLLLFKASMLNNDGHNFAHFPNTFANLDSEENDVAVTVFTLSSVHPLT